MDSKTNLGKPVFSKYFSQCPKNPINHKKKQYCRDVENMPICKTYLKTDI